MSKNNEKITVSFLHRDLRTRILSERTISFDNLSEAYSFAKHANTFPETIGKPIIEDAA